MPTLHRYTNQPGYYVRGVANGKPVAFQLTGEGEQYLLDTLELADGAKFSGDTLKWLYKRQWAANIDPPPEPLLVPTQSEVAPVSPDIGGHNPVVFHGVVHLQLSGVDHVLLDQSADEVVRTLRRTGAVVFGPCSDGQVGDRWVVCHSMLCLLVVLLLRTYVVAQVWRNKLCKIFPCVKFRLEGKAG